jgi:hypothetical protein
MNSRALQRGEMHERGAQRPRRRVGRRKPLLTIGKLCDESDETPATACGMWKANAGTADDAESALMGAAKAVGCDTIRPGDPRSTGAVAGPTASWKTGTGGRMAISGGGDAVALGAGSTAGDMGTGSCGVASACHAMARPPLAAARLRPVVEVS